MLTNKRSIGFILVMAIGIGLPGCGSSSSSSGGASMDQMAAEQAAKPPAEPEKKVVGRAPVAPGGGYYSAIIGARRHILNESESWAWKQGVGSFRATNGRKPKDNNEFMKQVIAAMDIPLPHKEENEEYFYDPKGETDGDYGQLYVIEKQPASNNGSVPGGTPAAK
jgi:hypothetical protein